jgi:GntR family transcriptional regulator/MocR family aminotransferase
MDKPLQLHIDRTAKTPLADQIRLGITTAIDTGVLAPGARLPSWIDLATQLGVGRGTVKAAYDKLLAAQLVVTARAAGTRVAGRPPVLPVTEPAPDPGSFMETYLDLIAGPGIFQVGVPAQETFPAKLMARIRAQAVRAETAAPAIYPDPRGEPELRREIAAYLAVARGVPCSPSRVLVTDGYSGGLGLVLHALGLEGRKAWFEDPGLPFIRKGLELARMTVVPVPVDGEGIDVEYGVRHAPDAALALVTPGQQAPLGPVLSLARRLRLLEWAAEAGAWIIEDDYLSELQLDGRAAPALASLDRAGRVIHLGTFSKTISPTFRLGFIVAPQALAVRLAEVAACLAPPPGPAVQLATAEFMREGHYLRHLRRSKRVYAARRDSVLKSLKVEGGAVSVAGLTILLRLPAGVSDVAIVREASAFGISPSPLSAWYASPASAPRGLLLGLTSAPPQQLEQACDRLNAIVGRFL